MRAVIVAGPMKTGTTALALGLSRLARLDQLPDGVTFPVDSLWPFESGGREIVKHSRQLKVLAGHLKGGHSAELRAVRMALSGLVSGTRTRHRGQGFSDRTIFVWEGLAHVLGKRPSALELFHEALLEHFDEVQYVFGIRRQDEALRSLYVQQIRGNRGEIFKENLSFASFIRLRISEHAYDYFQIYKTFEAAGISDTFLPLDYLEENIGTSRYLQSFFSKIGAGLADVTETSLDGRLVHPSLSIAVLSVIKKIRQVQAQLPKGARLNTLLEALWIGIRTAELRRLDGVAKKSLKTARNLRFSVENGVRDEILRRYEESNSSLALKFPDLVLREWRNRDPWIIGPSATNSS